MIIPCYNESENIPFLFNEIHKNQKKINFEIIIINNGSTDLSSKVIDENKYKLKNFKLINISENIGFGNGVKRGLLEAKNSIVCYTHGDLQIKVDNCLKAFKIFKKNNENLFIKSKRKKRDLISIFFTTLMGVFNSLVFKTVLTDIHSQPNMFKKPSREIILNCPDDMGIDLYFYALFKIKKYPIIRFDIQFEKRIHGIGNNDLLIKKLFYSFKSLKNSFIVKKKINEIR